MPQLDLALGVIDRWVADGVVPGAAVAVARHGVLIGDRYAGKSAAGAGLPVGPDTLYSVASITKIFTATLAMRLVDAGLCSLDEPVRRWVPDFAGSERREIGLRELLSHTSGMPKDDPAELELWAREASFAEIAASCSALPLVEQPGTRVTYSNAAYWVAGAALSTIVGAAFPDALREWVIEPAGLRNTFINPPAEVYPRIARRYGRTKIVNAPYGRRLGSPAGGLFASVRDLARFAGSFNRATGLISPGALSVMTSDQTGGLAGGIDGLMTWPRCAWGIGWEVRCDKRPHWTGGLTSPRTVCHIGQGGGLVWFDPDSGLSVAILANRDLSTGWATDPARWARLNDAIVAAAT